MKKFTYTAIVAAMGLAASGNVAALTAGSYTMYINETPDAFVPGSGVPDVGCSGAATLTCTNSSFTFGGQPSTSQSNKMTDNGTTVSGLGGIDGDGWAGVLSFSVDAAGNMTFSSFSVDTVLGTAAGDFAAGADPSAFTGTVDAAGNMTFSPTSRFGNTSGPVIVGNPFNVDGATTTFDPATGTFDPAPTWVPFTTGLANGPGTFANIQGSSLALNADGNWDGVLVSTTDYGVGPNWGTFDKGTYYEVWDVVVMAEPAVIPVPAAVWLFGSGLLGLVGVARRRKAA